MQEFFAEDLILLQRLAEGGMGEVYRALQFGMGGFEKTVAVKRLLPSNAGSKEFNDMFLRETAICATLQNPHIVQIFRNGIYEQFLYLVMEFIHGKSLDQILEFGEKTNQLMPVEIACSIISDTAKGLDYAHSLKDSKTGDPLNLIHRDISPPNIMISYNGEVKIVDFGIATAAGSNRLTKAGTIKGKEGYLSPEQVNGLPLDRRSDIFSLGIVFFELLTGQCLFKGETTFATLSLISNCRIPDAREINPSINPELDRILLKCLAREPDDRYQTAGELQNDLAIFLNHNYPNFVSNDVAKYLVRNFGADIEKESRRIREDISQIDRRQIEKRAAAVAVLKEQSRSSSGPVVISNGVAGRRPTQNVSNRLTANTAEDAGAEKVSRSSTRIIASRQQMVIALMLLINLGLIVALLKHFKMGPFAGQTPAAQTAAVQPAELAPSLSPQQPARPAAESGLVEVMPRDVRTKEDVSEVARNMARSSAPFPPDGLRNLVLWHNAEDVKIEGELGVAMLRDLSKLDHPAEQPEPNRQPKLKLKAINQYPAVVFDGQTKYLNADSVSFDLRPAQGLTAFFVARSEPGKRQQYVFSITGPAIDEDILRVGFSPNGGARVKYDTTLNHYVDSLPFNTRDFAIYTAVFEQGYVELFCNGKLVISTNLKQPPRLSSAKFFTIGQEWDKMKPSDFWAGELAELIIYSRPLPYSERAGVEKFLSAKYQLPIQ